MVIGGLTARHGRGKHTLIGGRFRAWTARFTAKRLKVDRVNFASAPSINQKM
jgi:hypothetical protein